MKSYLALAITFTFLATHAQLKIKDESPSKKGGTGSSVPSKFAPLQVNWKGEKVINLRLNEKKLTMSAYKRETVMLPFDETIKIAIEQPDKTYYASDFLMIDKSGGEIDVWISGNNVGFKYTANSEIAALKAAEEEVAKREAAEKAAVERAEAERLAAIQKAAKFYETEGDKHQRNADFTQAVAAYQNSLNKQFDASVESKLKSAQTKKALAEKAAAEKLELETRAARQKAAKIMDAEGDRHMLSGDWNKAVAAYKGAVTEYFDAAVAAKLKDAESKKESAERAVLIQKAIEEISKNMISVSGGSFIMGCTLDQGSNCYSDEKPTHSVSVNSFKINKYETTQFQWKAIMGNNPSKFTGCDDCPVEQVSWQDIQEFIKKLNELSGKTFRLPTEAEWEFAARGGNNAPKGKSNTAPDIGSVAWYEGNSDNRTNQVGQKLANELGLFDTRGNVEEWCNDWYDEDYYRNSLSQNPKGPSSGTHRIIRGGSWSQYAWNCRVAARVHNAPDYQSSSCGFRLVAD